MAEIRNQSARRSSRKADAPAEGWLLCSEYGEPPLHSSTTHPENRHSSILSSTLAPISSLASLPPLSVLTSPVPCATARSECSSLTSVRGTLIRQQRTLLHHRRTLPYVNQDLAVRPSGSQRDALVVRRKSYYLMLAPRSGMRGDPCATIRYVHLTSNLAHPHFLAGILPRDRVAAPLPVHICIACHFPQFAIHKRIAKPAAERLETELFNVPSHSNFIACRSVYASVRHARHPLAQLRIHIREAARFASLQSAKKVPPQVLHSRLDLALGLRSIRPAQSWCESPVPGKIQKYRMPHDLASFIAA